jgi:PadR family transcriptional regulator, regulatory protein PadR
MNLDQCSCSGKHLVRLLRPAIMGILAREPVHGYLLAQRLKAMAMFRGQALDPTGMYRHLKSMEDEGLVASSWDLAEAGPARRRYALTAEGRECLTLWTETLEAYRDSVIEILGLVRTSRSRPKACGCKKPAARTARKSR